MVYKRSVGPATPFLCYRMGTRLLPTLKPQHKLHSSQLGLTVRATFPRYPTVDTTILSVVRAQRGSNLSDKNWNTRDRHV